MINQKDDMYLISAEKRILENIKKELSNDNPTIVFYENGNNENSIEVPIKIKQTGISKEENLVIKWMDHIMDIAIDDDYDADTKLEKIMSICKNIVICLNN